MLIRIIDGDGGVIHGSRYNGWVICTIGVVILFVKSALKNNTNGGGLLFTKGYLT